MSLSNQRMVEERLRRAGYELRPNGGGHKQVYKDGEPIPRAIIPSSIGKGKAYENTIAGLKRNGIVFDPPKRNRPIETSVVGTMGLLAKIDELEDDKARLIGERDALQAEVRRLERVVRATAEMMLEEIVGVTFDPEPPTASQAAYEALLDSGEILDAPAEPEPIAKTPVIAPEVEKEVEETIADYRRARRKRHEASRQEKATNEGSRRFTPDRGSGRRTRLEVGAVTPEQLVDGIRRFVVEVGRTPTEALITGNPTARKYGVTTARIRHHFGRFPLFLEEAGLESPPFGNPKHNPNYAEVDARNVAKAKELLDGNE